MEYQQQNDVFTINLAINKQKETNNLTEVKYQAEILNVDNNLKKADKMKLQEFDHKEKTLEV
jgi:hypothetical protein